MFVTQRRFYAVNFKLESVKLVELLGKMYMPASSIIALVSPNFEH